MEGGNNQGDRRAVGRRSKWKREMGGRGVWGGGGGGGGRVGGKIGGGEGRLGGGEHNTRTTISMNTHRHSLPGHLYLHSEKIQSSASEGIDLRGRQWGPITMQSVHYTDLNYGRV